MERLFRYRWWLWSAFAVLWTVGLLLPQKEKSFINPDWEGEFRFWFSKTVHVLAYAFFAGLSGWVRAPIAYRPMLMFALTAHAAATEFGQQFAPGRMGSLADVIRDHAGIALGYLATRHWWREDASRDV